MRRFALPFVFLGAIAVAACAPAPLYPAPASMGAARGNHACGAQVVREALPVEERDERILFSAGGVTLGELVVDADAQTSLYGERQAAASRTLRVACSRRISRRSRCADRSAHGAPQKSGAIAR